MSWLWIVLAPGSILLALFCWGRPVAWIPIAFAFAIHVNVASSAISRRPNLGFHPRWQRISLAAFLVSLVYLPALLLGATMAWPAIKAGDDEAIYLVNRRAYLTRPPAQGDFVWVEPRSPAIPSLAWVIAGEGQEVSWAPDQYSVDGNSRTCRVGLPGRGRFLVPLNHVLVRYMPDSPGRPPSEPVLVTTRRVVGKAWAQFYPIADRRFLRK